MLRARFARLTITTSLANQAASDADCVVLRSRTDLADCRRVLRTGGWLVCGTDHSSGAVRAAGFGSIRVYHAHPSADRPLALIPDDRRAILEYERLRPGRHAALRRVLASIGLHGFLYQGRVILASA